LKAELLRGYAAVTAGDLLGARRCLDASLEQAAGIGQPGLADRRERRVLDTVRAAVSQVVDRDDVNAEVRNTYEVRLLGGFEIRRNGELIASPNGRAADLVKWVSLAGGRASVEGVVELLWPDELPGIGLRRLKNVLSRSRASYGPLIHRDGSHLTLVDCRVDLVRFENAASQVALGRGAERVAHARQALTLYTGPVLPDDLYDDRIDQRREAVRRRALSLVDVVLTAVLVTGDLDAAMAVLQMAIDNDSGDQERPLRVARALVYAGRGLEARSLARQAVASATEYGMSPAAEWTELNLLGAPARARDLGS
jgi:DNA-binding SARP family transcriptional activator